jgi:trk system potassium uptake protein TrkA|tara:strand:+ start:1002 stop:1709 length:708 start_codon:yes stop_codon:yes gene_type:complete
MIKKQVAVIGMNRFGVSTIRALYNLGHDVLAIDRDEERVQAVLGQATYAITAECTNEAALRDLGVHDYDAAVVAIGKDIVSSVMASVLLKTIGVKFVVARAQDSLHANTLKRIGVDRIVQPEEEMGTRLAHSFFNTNVEEYIELTPNYGISRFRVPQRFDGTSLDELGFSSPRDSYGLTPVALCRKRKVTLNPDLNFKLKPDDVVIVAAHDSDLESLDSVSELIDQNSNITSLDN